MLSGDQGSLLSRCRRPAIGLIGEEGVCASAAGAGKEPYQMNGSRDLQPYKKDFWNRESSKFAAPHYRLQKAARLNNADCRS